MPWHRVRSYQYRRASRTLLMLLVGSFVGGAIAVQSTMLEVEREGDVYSLYSEMVVDAPLDEAYAILSDYEHLEQLSGIVKEVELIESPGEHQHRIYSVAEFCVLLFCGEVVQLQDIYETPNREILAITLPEQSNLKEGIVQWRFQPVEEGTHLTIFARVVPDFWVPPLVGPWAVKRALSDRVRETAENIERLSSGDSGSD